MMFDFELRDFVSNFAEICFDKLADFRFGKRKERFMDKINRCRRAFDVEENCFNNFSPNRFGYKSESSPKRPEKDGLP